ncbi:MAG: POT family MFS transporter [Pirellulales bacterium]
MPLPPSEPPADPPPSAPGNPYESPKDGEDDRPRGYLTAPLPIKSMPPGIPYIVGNEAAERFSYYGMKAILTVFMTKYLLDASGQLAPMSEAESKQYFHLFSAANYAFPIIGAILADVWLGKYRTILWLSVVYCLGHAALAVDETRLGLMIGLGLIAVGSGGIKPCVSSHVGDQFGKSNEHLLERVFSWFYFAINFGAAFSTLLTPILLTSFGPHVAFGIPGILMALATLVFWIGRNRFVHIPARGWEAVQEVFGPVGWPAILKLSGLYVFVAMFWSLFDQTGSAWVLQANHLDRVFWRSFTPQANGTLLMKAYELDSSQLQAVNPILIMLFIPLFSYVVYPLASKFVKVTPLRKISVGFFLAALSFAIPAWLASRIAAGETPHMAWQVLAYVVLTAAEVLVSITCLEFSYTQAPKKMKAFIMSLYLLSVTAGNLVTSGFNWLIQDENKQSRLSDSQYYWFFTAAMAVTALAFVAYSQFYREQRFIQDETS